MNINVTLSESGIAEAIRKLDEYKEGLKTKCGIFVQRLADLGLDVVRANMNPRGDYASPQNPTFRMYKNGRSGVLNLSGQDVLFIEFGAGVYYNVPRGQTRNPFALENGRGYTIGSYNPESENAGKSSWYYTGEDGKSHKTHGTEAGMPMYKASQLMRQNINAIAREVFKT